MNESDELISLYSIALFKQSINQQFSSSRKSALERSVVLAEFNKQNPKHAMSEDELEAALGVLVKQDIIMFTNQHVYLI